MGDTDPDSPCAEREIVMAELAPLGDRAFLAQFASEREAAQWVAAVRSCRLAGVTDVVLAYRSAAVYADPDQADLEELETRLRLLDSMPADRSEGKLVVIPVLYDGPDLQEVAARLSLSAAEVVRLHTDSEYDVFAIGFLPGFPYAGYLPPALSGLPRRDEPRLKVPAGSVAIAGRQTGIYPRESPGGWHLLGRTPLRIADPDAGYFPIRAGDRIRFQSIDRSEFEDRSDERL
jgi:KipI family sensor histidine kinase inhibitor